VHLFDRAGMLSVRNAAHDEFAKLLLCAFSVPSGL
jgi:hypothetical protein